MKIPRPVALTAAAAALVVLGGCSAASQAASTATDVPPVPTVAASGARTPAPSPGVAVDAFGAGCAELPKSDDPGSLATMSLQPVEPHMLATVVTSLEMVVIALCFMALGYESNTRSLINLTYWGELLALLSPMILVAYITTMLSADIRLAIDKIKRVSDTDDLTEIYNMRAFSSILQRAFKLAVRHAHPLCIVMIDCDNLKTVNDTHGHDAGNRLLRHVVRGIREELRASDVLARFGGDEFIALLPETEGRGGKEMAERIRRAVERSKLDLRGDDVVSTVSIGVSSYPSDGGNLEVIMDKADKAMYRAKQKGRNSVVAAGED